MGNTAGTAAKTATKSGARAHTIFGFTVKDHLQNNLKLEAFKGKKAFLIVNVASKWGLTSRNYSELQQLHVAHSGNGLQILGFPCNQFGGQEPGTDEEIQHFAQGKGATFPILAKIEVNGPGTHPLYAFLKSTKGEMLGADIKWNFAKFLVDRNGVPVARYAPTTAPLSFESDILRLLGDDDVVSSSSSPAADKEQKV